MKQLILGGARSGKSVLAERRAEASGKQIVYLATSDCPADPEMRQRVDQHQSRRPENWQLVEEPVRLAETIQQHNQEGKLLLVDCLTLWLSNLMHHERDTDVETDALCKAIQSCPSDLVLVSNEVGLGLVHLHEVCGIQHNALHERHIFLTETGFLKLGGFNQARFCGSNVALECMSGCNMAACFRPQRLTTVPRRDSS